MSLAWDSRRAAAVGEEYDPRCPNDFEAISERRQREKYQRRQRAAREVELAAQERKRARFETRNRTAAVLAHRSGVAEAGRGRTLVLPAWMTRAPLTAAPSAVGKDPEDGPRPLLSAAETPGLSSSHDVETSGPMERENGRRGSEVVLVTDPGPGQDMNQAATEASSQGGEVRFFQLGQRTVLRVRFRSRETAQEFLRQVNDRGGGAQGAKD
mmetsp:Transcript_9527/g.24177  ORF Transcript_9527/g.24177 Transcript_9527/m.24177 type:complete len:212 (+) Transcript_9527:184-819(+)|eukprot:CAMPEP_0202042036 /NCGR_PEP_ID=MMETSP0962-20130828/25991_1 /ASSEMBLY_ACC=CAM_ASM_000488 /TAXON_ID=4773 /ORGANISM="Schizochytrium aggregatum, Strain ATCC28209" /LENGTH=211 /DNA_ID=CAMNT_0048606405 /DNA_START=176 /DNA_END=811 /DNA_ORIENTATION=-